MCKRIIDLQSIYITLFLSLTIAIQGAIYKQPTEHFFPKIHVAALFIEHEGRILVLHRQEHKSQGNLWGIPGGKIDVDETPLEAAIRETREETGYDFTRQTIESLGTVYIEYNQKDHFTYHMFRVNLTEDPAAVKINFNEHKGFTWVTPRDGLELNLIQDEELASSLFIIFNFDEVLQ